MTHERRSEVRRPLPPDIIEAIRLEIDGQPVGVTSIVNISPTGIGLRITEPLREGSKVEVVYTSDEIALRLPGNVAWTADAEGPAMTIGVQLLSPSLLHTFI